MWSDDSDTSSTHSVHGAATGTGSASGSSESSSSLLDAGAPFADTWSQSHTGMFTQSSISRPTDMDLELDGPPHSTTQPHFYQDYVSDDDDDDDDHYDITNPLDPEIPGGILAVASVLSHGMDLEQTVPDHTQAGIIMGSSAPLGHYSALNPVQPFAGSHAEQPVAPTFHQAVATVIQEVNTSGVPQDAQEPTAANNHHGFQDPFLPQGLAHHPLLVHPNAGSNMPNATPLGPENFNLPDFLRHWAWQNGALQSMPGRERGRFPLPSSIESQMSKTISHVDYMDLEGDRCDVQGIDWDALHVTRGEARERRLNTYKNYVNISNSDRWQTNHDMPPCRDNFFRFRRMDARKNISLAHFQLRNVLASTSRSQVFYPGQSAVHEFNPTTGRGKVTMRSKEAPSFQVSTLAADDDILVAGGFFGEYCFRRFSEAMGEVHEGTITTDNSGITNHVQLYFARTSSSPRAAFASNDNGFRVLDIATQKFISETYYSKPINCSAISPDGRLRVMVGDDKNVLIAKAEADGQPEVLKMLSGHGDFGFACDWADDGWTVATGFQDKSVKIWDARRWTDARGKAQPVCTLRSEIAGVRSLRFSPLGSGKRVLVAAEEADFINIYDARTFQSKQTFDFFGEIGGCSFANEGRDLHVLCCDRARGGLFQLERCGDGAERNYDPADLGHRTYDRVWKNGSYDWQEYETTPRRLPRQSETRRRRRALDVGALDPF